MRKKLEFKLHFDQISRSQKWLSIMLRYNSLFLALAIISVGFAKAEPSTEMTPQLADAVLTKYVTPTENRGGLCVVGFNPGASLDYSQAVTVTDANIEFIGQFGKGHLLGKAFVGTIDIKVESRKAVVNASELKKIRVIHKRVENLRKWCPNVMPQYLVVLYPRDSLPSDAEASINVNSRAELDEVMSALTYLSPKARIKGMPKN